MSEDPKVRPAIDRMTKHLTQHGVPSEKAQQIAREQAIKHEKREKR